MSRVGKKPIPVLSGARIELKDNLLEVEGPRGKLSLSLHPLIKVRQENGHVWVERLSEEKNVRAFHGLTRSLINNLIIGVTQGFKKELEVVGIGYNAKMEGKKLLLQVGYSHPVYYEAPEGVSLSVRKERNFIITVEGIDKQKVGEAAAEIRRIRPPEPYKGKGIRYLGEHIRLKAGKKGAKA
ncbi:MAG: 50S ribosomal protein L6 [Caldiserica bacterium]|nr:50S ribosomal protein L6 [Caldisericota bacterium]